MITIARESPRQDDVIALIRQSDALMQSLYPAESNHLVDAESLAVLNVHFFVAREHGRALGCGAFVLGEDRSLAISAGDLLAILSAGAYAMVMASNYNTRPRPCEVLVDRGEAREVRARERVESLFALEKRLEGA